MSNNDLLSNLVFVLTGKAQELCDSLGPGRVPENRTAIMTRRSLMSMSSNARFGLGPVPRLGGPAAVDVGGAVAGTGVPDNDQGVHEHREWHVALHGPLDPVAGLTCAQHVASVGERHG